MRLRVDGSTSLSWQLKFVVITVSCLHRRSSVYELRARYARDCVAIPTRAAGGPVAPGGGDNDVAQESQQLRDGDRDQPRVPV